MNTTTSVSAGWLITEDPAGGGRLNTTTFKSPRLRYGQPLEVIQQPRALLRMETMAALSGRSIATLYRDAQAGKLQLVKMGSRCTRIRAEDARAYLEAQGGAS